MTTSQRGSASPETRIDRNPGNGQAKADESLTQEADSKPSDGGAASARSTSDDAKTKERRGRDG